MILRELECRTLLYSNSVCRDASSALQRHRTVKTSLYIPSDGWYDRNSTHSASAPFLLGLHAERWLNWLKKKKTAFVILSVIITLIAAFGSYAFMTNRLYEYMCLQTQFVFFYFDKPSILTLCEYHSMIVMFAWIGYWLKRIMVKRR